MRAITCRTQHKLLIFLRGVNSNFEVSEELAALKSLKGTMTGEYIFGKVCQPMGELDLDWSKLASITTDGAPSTYGWRVEGANRTHE